MDNRKVTSYILYAFGEIILVVIGILIAVNINNWNESKKNLKREGLFLTNLQQDLKADSLRLVEIENILSSAVKYKKVFEDYLTGKSVDKDSLYDHLLGQYNILTDFIPNSTTIDELRNSGLILITDPLLRRQVISLYNNYEIVLLKLQLGKEKGQIIINHVSREVDDVNNPTKQEILSLLDDKFYVNQTRMNYLVTEFNAVQEVLQDCTETLRLIRNELIKSKSL